MGHYLIGLGHNPWSLGGGDADSDYSEPGYLSMEGTYEEAKKIGFNEAYQKFTGHFLEREKFRLVTLSGPSCAGKGPLQDAINTFYPDLKFSTVPVVKSRESRPNGPRPGEIEKWNDRRFFDTERSMELRSSPGVLGMQNNHPWSSFVTCNVYGFSQGIDIYEIIEAEHDIIFIEAYPDFIPLLRRNSRLGKCEKKNIFISPFSGKDLKKNSGNIRDYIYFPMKDKLIKRTLERYQAKKKTSNLEEAMKYLTEEDIKDIEKRSLDAYRVMRYVYDYEHVITNPYGEEDLESWNREPYIDDNGQVKFRFRDKPIPKIMEIVDTVVEIIMTGKSNRSLHGINYDFARPC